MEPHPDQRHVIQKWAPSLIAKRRVEWVVVSTPGMGPEQHGGNTSYTFDVMGALQVLCYWKIVVLGYDWAGSTNVYPDDEALFAAIFGKRRPSFEKTCELVYKTRW